MSEAEKDIVRCQIRLPQQLYQEIIAIARTRGAKINPRTQRPQLSATLMELLEVGLAHYDYDSASDTPSTPQQPSQNLEEKLIEIQASQQQTHAELSRLYALFSQLGDRFDQLETSNNTSSEPTPKSVSHSNQWMVNRQWLRLNNYFSEDHFREWKNGEVRQDKRGDSWRRVDLASGVGDFKIPLSLAESQVFYVRE